MIINTDFIYPIGSIYISTSSVNPEILFGGKWESIKDKFLLTAGDTYTAGSTGGSTTHTHNYGIQFGGYYRSASWEQNTNAGVINYNSSNNVSVTTASSIASYTAPINNAVTTSVKDSSMSHYRAIGSTSFTSTLPPYLVVYAWRRVS